MRNSKPAMGLRILVGMEKRLNGRKGKTTQKMRKGVDAGEDESRNGADDGDGNINDYMEELNEWYA